MTDLPQTRQSLLLRLSQRSDDAWAEFIEIYEKAIYEFCRRRGLQDADSRDVTQDVLAAVDERVENWNGDPKRGKFRGWIFRVARNIAVDKFLERSRKAAASGDSRVIKMLSEWPDSDETNSTAFWMEYRRALMHWAANKVRPEVSNAAWKSFWLTAIEGQSSEDVANELETTVGSVYTAKCRVFARIRKVISQFSEEDDGLALETIQKNL